MYKKKIPEIVKTVSMVSNFLRISFIPTFPGNPGNLDPVSGNIFLKPPARYPFDSPQVSTPTIYVIAPSKHHPILQCRSGLPLEPVTGN